MTWVITAGVVIGASVGAGSAAASGKKGADIGKAAGIGAIGGAFTGGIGGALGGGAAGGAAGGTGGAAAGTMPGIFSAFPAATTAPAAGSAAGMSFAPMASSGSGGILASLSDPKNLQLGMDATKLLSQSTQSQAPQPNAMPQQRPIRTTDITTPSSAATAQQSVPSYSFDRKKRLDAMGY